MQSEHFFFRHKWLPIVYGIVAVSSALLAPMNLRFGDVLHRIQAGVQLVMAVTFGWLGWYWWRTWKHPLVTVSDEVIEWGEASPHHRERVLMQDVLELIPPRWAIRNTSRAADPFAWYSVDKCRGAVTE